MSPTRSYSSWRNEKLADPERAARYLSAAYEESTEAFVHALRNVIQARSVSTVAKSAGMARESLYRTENPTLTTLRPLLHAIGVKIPGFEPVDAVLQPLPSSPPTQVMVKGRRGHRGIKGSPRQILQMRFDFEQPSLAVATPASPSAITVGTSSALHIGTVLTGAEQGYLGVTEIEIWSRTLPGFPLNAGGTNSIATFAQQ